MRSLVWLLAGCLAAPAGAVVPLKKLEGRWARYEVVDPPDALPRLTALRLGFPQREKVGEAEAIWFQLEAYGGESRLYALGMLVAETEFLYPGGTPVPVARYVLFPAQGPPLEYVEQSTALALVPRLAFFSTLLPHAAQSSDPDMPFFSRGVYLGRALLRVEEGDKASMLPVSQARRLVLDTDVLVGTSRSVRDVRGQRLLPAAPDWTGEEPDYEYRDLTQGDYEAMIEAGFNLFRVPLAHLPYVLDQPVHFVLREGFEELPELLYRSNFLGAVMYMDEPAYRALSQGLVTQADSPQDAATAVLELTRGRYEGPGGYGQRNLDLLLRQAGYDLGAPLLQPDYPVWETVASASWYEQQAGVAGWCFEGRYQPEWFAALVLDQLGVDFPSGAESCIRFHHAFFTGAARRFGGEWGEAIYGQMDPAAARLVFPLAYEQGARYFWLWTSDRAHHVPFGEQVEHARAVRRYQADHPRQPRRQLTAAARVAVALPWGYLCDHYGLKTYESRFAGTGGEHPGGRLWWSPSMELGDLNREGVPYREVLAAAVRQAVALLREGTPFDFVFLGPEERVEGYERLYRVLENGQVEQEWAR
ncbi:MAG: hypothetical protein AB1505_25875 [Candidatus Latescibacterota bacterium]